MSSLCITYISQALNRQAAEIAPGAHGFVDVRGWNDPSPVCKIVLRNGAEFANSSSRAVVHEATAFVQAFERLTGGPHDHNT